MSSCCEQEYTELVEGCSEFIEECAVLRPQSSLNPESFHSQYEVLKTIGCGYNAKVKLAKHRLTGTEVAVKVINKRELWSEAAIMRKMNHPNIISLLQVIDSDKKTYLIMELAEGEQLYEYVQKADHLQEDEARGIFRQILSGVGYCHKIGIIHRDLKPQNIMIDRKGNVKIIDFGLGTQVKPGERVSFVGATFGYCAPELFVDGLYNGPKADIWALGVLLYYMVVGDLPFCAVTSQELQKRILKGEYTVPWGLSSQLRDLLRYLMTVSPGHRPMVDEVMTHPWLKKDMEDFPNSCKEMVLSLPDPAVLEAMEHLGFQAKDIKESLCQRKFDQNMATYCLLQGQALQENICTTSAQGMNPGVAPFPSLEDPVAFPLPPRRRRSEPALGTLLRGPSTNGQVSACGQQAGQRGDRRASESAPPLCRPPKMLPKMCSCCEQECTELVEGCSEFIEECAVLRPQSSLNPDSFHSQYEVLKTIGCGCNAKVKLAKHRLTGTEVAVKVINKRKMWCFPLMSEAAIMRKMNHPNIISLLQVIDSDKKTYLIMELAEGEQLYEYVQKADHLQEDEARGIFRQILSAVSYCHKIGIIHRDLKPQNIMIDRKGNVKIIDFGLGTQVKPGQVVSFFGATNAFCAPELLVNGLYDGPKADIWALGVLLYYMVVGNLPFCAVTSQELQKRILKGEYTVPLGLSKELQDLLSFLMTVSPRRRPMVDEVMTHPWLKKDMEDLPNPCEEMVPILLDPAVLEAMEHLGFQAQHIKESLCQRKFDQNMATYCLLQGQALQENICTTSAQGMNPGMAPFPSLEDPVAFPLPPRRRRSEPALGTLLRGPSTNGQVSVCGQQAGQRGDRRASESALPLCRSLQRTPTFDQDHQRSKSAPCTYSVSGSNEKTEENLCSHSASAEGKSTHSRGQRRGWRGWTRRIGNALMNLCCCCFPSRQNSVSPQK